MWLPRVFPVFMSFVTILAQQESLVELQLSLREEEVPVIINYVLDNRLEEHGITTMDILRLSKLDRCDENCLKEVLGYFDVTDVYTVDNLEILLKGLGMTFGEFNRALTAKLGLTNQQVGQVLNDLAIPLDFWRAVAMNDDNIFNILKQGQYDDEHVTVALQTAGKTLNEVYSRARDSIAEKVLQLPSSAFMDLLRANGWTVTSAAPLYKALQLTPEDVYNVQVFRDIFINITETLNQNLSLGVFVGSEQIAVHKLLYDNLQQIADGITVRVVGQNSEVLLAQTEPLGENIVGLGITPPVTNFIGIVEAYNSTEECSYIVSGRVTPVQVEDFMVEKNDQTQFVLGGALVCEGNLYGLAGSENETVIFFDGFYTGDNPPPEDFNSGVIFSPTVLTFVFIIALL